MRNKGLSIVRKAGKLFLVLFVTVTCASITANASGASIISSGFTNFTDIVKAFVSAVGTIILLWGIFEWGNAMQSNDGMMQSMAFKRIGGGLVMTLGPQLISLFIS